VSVGFAADTYRPLRLAVDRCARLPLWVVVAVPVAPALGESVWVAAVGREDPDVGAVQQVPSIASCRESGDQAGVNGLPPRLLIRWKPVPSGRIRNVPDTSVPSLSVI